jgi:hypothetical protein
MVVVLLVPRDITEVMDSKFTCGRSELVPFLKRIGVAVLPFKVRRATRLSLIRIAPLVETTKQRNKATNSRWELLHKVCAAGINAAILKRLDAMGAKLDAVQGTEEIQKPRSPQGGGLILAILVAPFIALLKLPLIKDESKAALAFSCSHPH